jgi:Transmembrane protein 43
MSDVYRSVTSRGLGDNLVDSIKGIGVGIILFLVSFPVLWWNEGRLDISTVAKKAAVVKADASDTAGEGALVAVTAPLKAEGTLGDDDFLKPGPHIVLKREVEMYAWVETKKSETRKKLGGGSETITTYTYDKKWTSSPRDSSDFSHPEGHDNPSMSVSRKTFHASKALVGGFSFSPEEAEVPSATALDIHDADLTTHEGRLTGSKYLYRGKGSLDMPSLGDVRIWWEAVDGGKTATLYGKRQGKEVVAYVHEGKNTLYRALWGTHEEAVATLHGEHTTMTWILRLVGFLMMWFGLALVLGPIHAILDIIPFIGSTGRALAGIVLFPVALVLSGITIITSIIAHNPILLVLVVLAVVGVVTFVVMKKKKQKAEAQAKAA